MIFRAIDATIQLVPLSWEDLVKIPKMEACWALKGFQYKTKTVGSRSDDPMAP
jgi:hypothetical protein